MNIINRMQNERPNLTKSELKVCDYILCHLQDTSMLTISRIAELSKSSKSAVLRFSQKLGFSGYSELRYELIRFLHSNKAGDGSSHLGNPVLSEYTSVFARAVEAMANLPKGSLVQFARWIHRAPIIRVMGMVKSSLPALKFYYDFSSLGKNVFPITDNLTPGMINGLMPDDLIVIFSAGGRISSTSTRDFIECAQEKGCSIVLITTHENSELFKIANLSLIIPTVRLESEAIIDGHALMVILVDIIEAYFIETQEQNNES